MREIIVKRTIKNTKTGLRALSVNIRNSAKITGNYNKFNKKIIDDLVKYSKRKNVNVKNLDKRIEWSFEYLNSFNDLTRKARLIKNENNGFLYVGVSSYRKPRAKLNKNTIKKSMNKYYDPKKNTGMDDEDIDDYINGFFGGPEPDTAAISGVLETYGVNGSNIQWMKRDPEYLDMLIRLRDAIDNVAMIEYESNIEDYFTYLFEKVV